MKITPNFKGKRYNLVKQKKKKKDQNFELPICSNIPKNPKIEDKK